MGSAAVRTKRREQSRRFFVVFASELFVTIMSCLKDTVTLGTRSGSGLTVHTAAKLLSSSMLPELLRSPELEFAEVIHGACWSCRAR